MLIARQKRWDRHALPPQGVRLDAGHRFAACLEMFLLFNQGGGWLTPDLSGRGHDATQSAAGAGIGWAAGGRLATATAGAERVTFTKALPNILSADLWSWDALIRFDGGDAFGSLFTPGGTAGIFITSAGKLDWVPSAENKSLTTMTAGKWYHWCLTSNGASATGVTMYCNGLVDTTGFPRDASAHVYDSLLNDAGSETCGCVCAFQRLWRGRVLIPSEVLSLYEDPYQMLMPQAPTLRWFNSVGIGYVPRLTLMGAA